MCGEGVCGECGGSEKVVLLYSSALYSIMLLFKLCGLQTEINLVVRIMCPLYTVSTGPSPTHTQPGHNIRI